MMLVLGRNFMHTQMKALSLLQKLTQINKTQLFSVTSYV